MVWCVPGKTLRGEERRAFICVVGVLHSLILLIV